MGLWRTTRRHSPKAMVILALLVVCYTFLYFKYVEPWSDYIMPFPLPEVLEVYRTVQQTEIPRIIHQIWHNSSIPNVYIENLLNLTRHNPHPHWTYYLWTWDSARKLLKRHFPEVLPFFERRDVTEKSDILRYAVLYLYGGVYLDMDTVSVKPLETFLATPRYSMDLLWEKSHGSVWASEMKRKPATCLFSYEPPDHEFAYHTVPIVSTAAVLCQKKHPLFLYILKVLPMFEENHCTRAVYCTGPGALTKILKHYFEALRKDKKESGIDVLESIYFQDKADHTVANSHFMRCLANLPNMVYDYNLLRFRRRLCSQYLMGNHLKISEHAVTYHTYDHITPDKVKFYKNIKDIVPNCNVY